MMPRPKSGFFRPTWVEISHKNLAGNFRSVSNLTAPGTKVLAVVKADAYGHGLLPVARTLAPLRPAFFGVTSVEEGLLLRRARLAPPPLILGNSYPFESLGPAIRNGIRVTVASLEAARFCDRFARRLKKKVFAHAKIDTGMGRIGVGPGHAAAFIDSIRRLDSIRLEGVYTHFSSVAEDPGFTDLQVRRFAALVEALRSRGTKVPYFHCANSMAILRRPEAHYSLVRPGISLYGALPFSGGSPVDLRPVLSWKSRIVFIKDVPAGGSVSYARAFVAKRKSRVATAAFGYADGYRRILSNRGKVLVRGRRVPVIGRVTMDMTMLDVTGLPEARVGDEVALIGAQGNERISAAEVAEWSRTSPYEVFCSIAARVPRVPAD